MALCLISLISGTEASFIHRAVERSIELTAYPFLVAKAKIERATDYAAGFVFSYDLLQQDNASMRKDIARLQRALLRHAELHQQNRRLRNMLHFAREEPRLALEPVQVLESFKGVLRIDRGASHGITTSMCAITEKGVVGIITEVSRFTSVVATVHHPECKIGAMVRRNRLRAYDGVIHAGGGDINPYCTMHYIDMKEDVRKGDLVVTSPESVFPAGYPIGIITAIHEAGTLWKTAEVMPHVDPYRLDEVFVVRRALPEARELAGRQAASPLDRPRSVAPEMPDERPIQERYAP